MSSDPWRLDRYKNTTFVSDQNRPDEERGTIEHDPDGTMTAWADVYISPADDAQPLNVQIGDSFADQRTAAQAIWDHNPWEDPDGWAAGLGGER